MEKDFIALLRLLAVFIQCEIATFRQFGWLWNPAVPRENLILPFSCPWLLAASPRHLLGWLKLCVANWGTQPRNCPVTSLLSALGYLPTCPNREAGRGPGGSGEQDGCCRQQCPFKASIRQHPQPLSSSLQQVLLNCHGCTSISGKHPVFISPLPPVF